MTEALSKTQSSKWLYRGAMSWKLDCDKIKFSLLSIFIACTIIPDKCTSLWVNNNILMNISGTKENGKFDNGENLDIDARMFLTKYDCS